MQALFQSDEEVLKACEIAAGRRNLASKQTAMIRRHLEAAVEADQEMAQDLLDRITENPQATAQVVETGDLCRGFSKVFESRSRFTMRRF